MLATALSLGGPCAIRYPRGRGPGTALLEGPLEPLPVGKAQVLSRGRDVTLVGLGSMVTTALEVAELLEAEGLSVGVVNARFAKPLDTAFFHQLAAECRLVVTLEENVVQGGFGQAVRSLVEEVQEPAKVLNLGLPDQFITHGSRSELLAEVQLDPGSVAQAVLKRLGESGEPS